MDFTRRTDFDEILRDQAFNIVKTPEYNGDQRGLASMVLLARSETLATQNKSASSGAIKNENISNKELSSELLKAIIRKFKERKML